MKSEDLEFIKENPLIIPFGLALLVLIYLYQRHKLEKSKNDKNKIVGFDKTGLIPIRESYYDYFNWKNSIQIFILKRDY